MISHTSLLALATALLLVACNGNPPSSPASATAGDAEPRKQQAQEPAVALHADGFPTGHGSPEGVACDLARAFIARDASLFASSCIAPFGAGDSRSRYAAFLEDTSESIEAESRQETMRGPKSIDTVFAARHLTAAGPASYGFASFEFQDLMFVDVKVELHGGGHFENRTLVIQSADNLWYAHPFPEAYPLLSVGLNEETDSTAVYHPSATTPER